MSGPGVLWFHSIICFYNHAFCSPVFSQENMWMRAQQSIFGLRFVSLPTSTRLMSSSRKLSSFCSCSSCCQQNQKHNWMRLPLLTPTNTDWHKAGRQPLQILLFSQHRVSFVWEICAAYLSLVSPGFFKELHEDLSLSCLGFLVEIWTAYIIKYYLKSQNSFADLLKRHSRYHLFSVQH